MNNMEAIEVLRRTKPIVTLVVARVNEHSSLGSELPGELKHGLSEDDINAAITNSDNYSKSMITFSLFSGGWWRGGIGMVVEGHGECYETGFFRS